MKFLDYATRIVRTVKFENCLLILRAMGLLSK